MGDLKANGEAKLKKTSGTRSLTSSPKQETRDMPMSNSRNVRIPSNTPSRQDQATLSKEIGLRMRESRDMVGMSQQDAAKRFGYSNSSKLAKIENGQSSAIPLWVIRKAALAYDVSIDFLFGVTGTMERDDVSHAALREMNAFLYAEFDRRHAQDVAATAALQQRVATIEEMLVLTEMQLRQLRESHDYVAATPEWQEVRGGNRLTNNLDRLTHTVQTASMKYKDIRRSMRARAGMEHQMTLCLEV